MDIEFPHALPATIKGDSARLRQILTNLIGNAIKFTERGGVVVRSRLERSGEQCRYCIDIGDSGIGISPDKLDTVFEPFVQAESSTTRRFGGTGLGLTISRGFARAMDGDILVSSVPGQGTTFSLWLAGGEVRAANLIEPSELAAATLAPLAPQSVRWAFPPRSVLVVDDGAENRQLVRVLLEDVGLKISEAENGQIALDRLASESFDLVLMDMQMPVMDGEMATRILRERGFTLPIIALTANAMKGFERELVAAGFSGYQTKPINVDALLDDLAQRLGGEVLIDTSGVPVDGASEGSAQQTASKASDRFDSLDTFDEGQPIVSRLAGHAKLGRIVERFVAQLPEKMAQMEDAANTEDFAELATLAHWLKGAGGSMGFDELFEPSKLLEEAASEGNGGKASQVLHELKRLVQRILRGSVLPQDDRLEIAG
ncbi:MAG: ATP-binding protein [Propionivibrio sp.]